VLKSVIIACTLDVVVVVILQPDTVPGIISIAVTTNHIFIVHYLFVVKGNKFEARNKICKSICKYYGSNDVSQCCLIDTIEVDPTRIVLITGNFARCSTLVLHNSVSDSNGIRVTSSLLRTNASSHVIHVHVCDGGFGHR
jgi:hypothetical protein